MDLRRRVPLRRRCFRIHRRRRPGFVHLVTSADLLNPEYPRIPRFLHWRLSLVTLRFGPRLHFATNALLLNPEYFLSPRCLHIFFSWRTVFLQAAMYNVCVMNTTLKFVTSSCVYRLCFGRRSYIYSSSFDLRL